MHYLIRHEQLCFSLIFENSLWAHESMVPGISPRVEPM
jgi:hypothetical protein